MRRFLALAAAAIVLPGCIPRPVDDYRQEVWTAQKVDVKADLRAVQFLDATTGYVVGADGVVLKTADGGTTWTSIYPVAVLGKDLLGLSFLDQLQGYAISGQALYRTADGGTTWEEAYDFKASHQDEIRAVRFLTPTAGFVVGAKGVYHTLDSTSWVKADVPRGSAVEPAGTTTFVAGTYLYSTDLTGTYVGVPASGTICPDQADCGAAMHFRTPTEGWLLAASGDVSAGVSSWTFKRTRDGGASWTDADPQGSLRKLARSMNGIYRPRVRFASADHGWVLQGGDFLATGDGGATWQRQAQFKDPGRDPKYALENPAFGFADISVPDATHAWVVGSGARIYKWENRYYPPQIDDNGLQIGSWRCCP